MAKSFDKLVRKTGNKKTKKIAAKRTQELMETYEYTNFNVKLPEYDSDVTIELPNGEILLLQFRPSNADIDTKGSFDIILPKNQGIVTYKSDSLTKPVFVNHVKQITTELPFGE